MWDMNEVVSLEYRRKYVLYIRFDIIESFIPGQIQDAEFVDGRVFDYS